MAGSITRTFVIRIFYCIKVKNRQCTENKTDSGIKHTNMNPPHKNIRRCGSRRKQNGGEKDDFIDCVFHLRFSFVICIAFGLLFLQTICESITQIPPEFANAENEIGRQRKFRKKTGGNGIGRRRKKPRKSRKSPRHSRESGNPFGAINFRISAHFTRKLSLKFPRILRKKKRRERGDLSAKMDSRFRGNDGGEAHILREN